MATKVKLIAAGVITPSELTLTTASAGTNTVTPATTAFVQQELTSGLAPKATIASPTFTGTPSAPTAAGNTTTTQLATTAFVQQEITTLIGGAPSTLNDLNELAAAINDDANYNSTLTTALATKLPLAGGTITGTTKLNDSIALQFGTDSDGSIHHDGSHFRLRAATGNFNIQTNDFHITDKNNTTVRFLVDHDGGTILTYAGVEKLATTSTGINVTGTITGDDGLSIQGGTGNAYLQVGSDTGSWTWKNYRSSHKLALEDSDGTGEVLNFDTSGNATFAGNTTVGGEVRTTNINTASSTGTLTMYGGATNPGGKIVLSGGNNTGATGSGIVFHAGASTSSPAERMRIDSSGRVGINNTSPSSQFFNNLVVGDNSAGDKGITIRANSANKGVLAFSDTDSADSNRYTGYIAYQHTDNSMRFYTNGGGERMRIKADGHVGIRNTNPAATLEVGTLTSGSTGNVIINSEGGNPPALQVKSRTNRARINVQDNDTSGYIIAEGNVFSMGFADAVSNNNININTSHNVGIGTASPTQKLDVAGTALVENAKLKAIAESNSDTAVDVFVYDTRKDSDGGAWRKRTQNTSWYNETLNTSTRGARKEFPSVAVIVAETSEVTIYDGDDPNLPMWMKFQLLNQDQVSIAAMNGIVCLGNKWAANAGYGGNGIVVFEFVADRSRHGLSNGTIPSYDPERLGVISGNQADTAIWTKTSGNAARFYDIIYTTVNDVSMTVLPNAPVDIATGLPVPTIAVATSNGLSVIKDTGSIVDITTGSGGYTNIKKVDISSDGYVAWTHNDTRSHKAAAIPAADQVYGFWSYNQGIYNFYESHNFADNFGNVPYLQEYSGGAREHIFGKAVTSTSGLTMIGLQKSKTAGVYGDADMPLTAYITSSYNTGWLNSGDKLAALSDTSTTNVTSPELVTNGTTFSNTTGWSGNSATVSVSGGELVVTGTGSFAQNQSANFTTFSCAVGDQFLVSFDITGFVANQSSAGIIVGGATIRKNGNNGYWYPNSIGTHTTVVDSTSTGFTLYLHAGISVGVITKFDNISVRKLNEIDRSHNNNDLQVFGTVPKTAVATGADLVAYGPFTSSNYLQQPYNSDLDFGTGDFMYSMWIYRNSLPTSTHERWFGTAATSTDERIDIFSNHNTDNIAFYSNDGGVNKGDVRITGIGIGQWHCLHFTRQGNVHKIYHNGELKGTTSGSSTLANYQGASGNRRTHIGAAEHWDAGHAVLDGKIALAKISGVVPTKEQIKKIYDDEKALFQENAKATLYGASNDPIAIAYDDDTELLHAGTSAGRSVFQGLRRIDNTTDAVGSAISASNGFIVED